MKEVIEQVLRDFSEVLSEKQYPKGYLLHRENTVCKHIYFVISGAMRSFYYKNGKDITAHFAMDVGVVSAVDSFTSGRPSRYNIEVIEEATALSLNQYDLERFLNDNPRFERTARLFVQQLYLELVDRVEDIMFNSAQERYEKLIKQNLNIARRVPLGNIASYLGITQETLSRVRATNC